MPIAGLSQESRDDDNDDDDDRVDVNCGARDTAPDGDANGEGRAGYIFQRQGGGPARPDLYTEAAPQARRGGCSWNALANTKHSSCEVQYSVKHEPLSSHPAPGRVRERGAPRTRARTAAGCSQAVLAP